MAKYPVRMNDDARLVRLVGWLFLLVTFGAFVQSYFVPLAQGSFESANIWMHPHAVVSFAFAALFIAQPSMVLRKNWTWHRIIGWSLAALVAGAVISGLGVQLGMWPTVPSDENNHIPAAFRLFSLLPCLVLFFVLAVILKKRSDWHWRLMIHAALAPVGTAIGRFTRQLEDPFIPAGPMINLITLIFILTLLASDKMRYGRTHPANWLGLVVFVASCVLALYISGTDWWNAMRLGKQ